MDTYKDIQKLNEVEKKYGITIKYAVYRGSIAHGCYIEGISDDIDIVGCFTYDIDHYIGIHHKKETITIMEDEYDILLYDVPKYLQLLAKGNPNVIASLYVEINHVLISDMWAYELRWNREMFNSKIFPTTFIGYANSQLDKMTRTTGNIGEARRKLIEEAGYNTKHAHHCIRLMSMLIDFYLYDDFFVDRRMVDDHEFLMDIKLGKIPLEDVLELHIELKNRIWELEENIDLPDEPDWPMINIMCKKAILDVISNDVTLSVKP